MNLSFFSVGEILLAVRSSVNPASTGLMRRVLFLFSAFQENRNFEWQALLMLNVGPNSFPSLTSESWASLRILPASINRTPGKRGHNFQGPVATRGFWSLWTTAVGDLRALRVCRTLKVITVSELLTLRASWRSSPYRSRKPEQSVAGPAST